MSSFEPSSSIVSYVFNVLPTGTLSSPVSGGLLTMENISNFFQQVDFDVSHPVMASSVTVIV